MNVCYWLSVASFLILFGAEIFNYLKDRPSMNLSYFLSLESFLLLFGAEIFIWLEKV